MQGEVTSFTRVLLPPRKNVRHFENKNINSNKVSSFYETPSFFFPLFFIFSLTIIWGLTKREKILMPRFYVG
jgi:hypothetical protein